MVLCFQIIKYCGDEHEMAMKEKNSASRNKVEMVESQDSSGKVVECLKQNFLKHIITNEVCKQVLASPQGVTVELELIKGVINV